MGLPLQRILFLRTTVARALGHSSSPAGCRNSPPLNQDAIPRLDRNANVEALDRSMTKKFNIEQQMSETPQMIPREQIIRTTGGAPQPDPAVQA